MWWQKKYLIIFFVFAATFFKTKSFIFENGGQKPQWANTNLAAVHQWKTTFGYRLKWKNPHFSRVFFTPTKWSEKFGLWWIEITFTQAYINYVSIRCKDCEIHSLWGSLWTNRDVTECKEIRSFHWLQWSQVPGETQRRWTGTGTMHPVNSRNWGHFMYSKWWVKLGVFSSSQRENRDKNRWIEILTAKQKAGKSNSWWISFAFVFLKLEHLQPQPKKMRTGDLRSTLPDVAWMRDWWSWKVIDQTCTKKTRPWVTCIINNLLPPPSPKKIKTGHE